MINVSKEFRETMKERTDFKCYAEAALADGRELVFTEDDFVMSGNSLTDGAAAGGLPLGAAVCRTVKLALTNTDGRLDECDFYGARIRLWLTFRLSETVERVRLGTFTVAEPESRGETVTITAGDDMILADRDFVPFQTGSATLGQLYMDVCGQCGLHYTTAEFPNSDMTVTVPEESYTCRQMLGYIALLAGGNARIDRQGDIEILTYDRQRPADHELSDWTSLRTDTDDIIITGLQVQTEDGPVREGEEGYVLELEDPLMEGREAEALRRVGDRLLGLRLRQFEGSHTGYPLAECMDTVAFTDRRGRRYTSVMTDVTFAFGGLTSLSNSAEGVVRNGSRYVSGETMAKLEARKLAKKERTARELAVEALRQALEESSGMYCTVQRQPDGSSVVYLHDKPDLEGSANVVKITANALGLSTDGGQSYPFGFAVNGEMIMGIIQAEGINADWILTGTVDLERLTVSGALGGIKEGHGAAKDGQTTKGILIYGSNGLDEDGNAIPPYMILTDAGWRVQTAEDAYFYVSGRTANMEGNIVATGSLSARGGIVYVGGNTAVNWNADATLMTFGNNAYRSWLAGRQVYVGENVSSYETYLRGGSIYASKTIQISSDRTMKKDVEPLPAAYAAALDRVKPVRYRYKTEPEGAPFHLGYVAQDVRAALEAEGLGDAAVVGEYAGEDGQTRLALAYEELIALLHCKIDRLEAEIERVKEALA